MSKLIPIGDRVLLKKIDIEQKSAGGIILGKQDDNLEFYFCKVEAVGDGKILAQHAPFEPIPPKVKVGDTVLVNPSQCIAFDLNGIGYLTISSASQIAFILED